MSDKNMEKNSNILRKGKEVQDEWNTGYLRQISIT